MTSRSIKPAASSRRESITLATRICAYCPGRAECLDYALSGTGTWGGIASGIWDGTPSRERALIRRQHRAAA